MIRVAITSLRGGAGVTALVSGMAQAADPGATAEGDSVGGLTTNGSVADAQQVGTATAQGA